VDFIIWRRCLKINNIKIDELFSTIDWCLKNNFPTDYDARCLYTACAIYTILKEAGVKSVIVGGDVGAFTLSNDGREASLEGFGGSSQDQQSHYWVEANGILLDPNISYLPNRSRIQRVQMPMIAWHCAYALPKGLQYKDIVRYDENVEFLFPDEFSTRISNFIGQCRKRYQSTAAKKKLSTWILSSPESLLNKARTGDRWSIGVSRFQLMSSTPTI
jgi:hypothetical protein